MAKKLKLPKTPIGQAFKKEFGGDLRRRDVIDASGQEHIDKNRKKKPTNLSK